MGQHAKIYGRAIWQKLRAEQLRQEPLCRYCKQMGRVVAADTVDHITPHRGDEALAFDPDNLQSLCKPCHDVHADAKDRGKVMAGCDADGYPIADDHPWGAQPQGGVLQKSTTSTSLTAPQVKHATPQVLKRNINE